MRILILSYGSRGDVQPFVALGLGLKAAGHQVTLATAARFEGFVTSHGLEFGALSDDMLALLETGEGREFLENANNPIQILTRLKSVIQHVQPLQDQLLLDCWEVARGFQPDFIVFNPKTYGGPYIAERLGVPVLLALPVPYLVPTGEHPNTVFPDLGLGAAYNLLTYHSVSALLRLAYAPYMQRLRSSMDLAPHSMLDLLQLTPGKDISTVHAISPHVVPRPPDWPDKARMTGYWFLDAQDDWTPPPQLEAFLAAGPPPVYVGFGSMRGSDPERLGQVVVDALQLAGLRGVVASGWGGIRLPALPDSILQIETAPHDWLFARMSALVHHGGAGTTAAGLRAGKPTVITPFFGDQPYWGKRVHALGAGSHPILSTDLTADALAKALTEVTTSPAIRTAAERLGHAIRAEDGVGEAVRLIEDLARSAAQVSQSNTGNRTSSNPSLFKRLRPPRTP